jgi:16S rRNA (cytosine1402-N4)-methyltransferase
MNMTLSAATHVPVLLEETIEALNVQPGGRYIDCTIGPGGHAAAIMEHSTPGGQLLGIDADPKAIKMARAKLDGYGDSVLLVNQNFANLRSICLEHGFFPVHGILFDLGLSSVQLEKNNRGFSFQHDSQLDMRLSPRQEVTADIIVNSSPESQLARIIRAYGEERQSQRIARYIVRQRPITSSLQLAQTVEAAVGGRRGRIHPATRTFQALRIAVNQELEKLQSALEQAVDLLGFGGRLVVISYHSLEDRVVKQFLQQRARGDNVCLRLINKKVITPSLAEVHYNPRSRSAKLRAAERISMPKEK